ncbi:MAG: TolC family protein [Proteobacteria bacterium]|nr:TolC family protein [Desulfocapsa sp.]MBU3944666.1 TolC family protein [Pseudomonadota bacterium]MCG2743266.1 TolC family protein [Desulfobacteraceae bacterium]MBU4030313.1 TolC family protein [Pseudomonadota bacterium]MBU4044083.1 TolC family protein [Pseudomonadota bacterium]
MHRIYLVFVFVLIVCSPPAFAVDGDSVSALPTLWTARQAVQFALTHSPDSQVALQRIEASKAMLDQVKASYYPQIGLNAEYGQTNNPMYSFGNILNQGQFDQSIDFNDPGRTDDLNLRAVLQYRFYNGGRDQAGIEAAEAGVAVSEMQQLAVSAQLSFEVVRTFNTIAQSMEMLEAHQASIKAIGASLVVARARFEAGDLLKADLLNIEVQESMAKENLILAEHSLELARKAFLNLLGLREGQVRIDIVLERDQELPEDRGYMKRPEIKGIEGQIQAAEAELRVALGGRYPTVDGLAHYQYDNGFVLNGSGDSWMGGVRVNYPLFTGGKTEADIANARARLAGLVASKKKLELALDFEVKQAGLAYRQAEQRLHVTDKMFEQAQESARLSRVRFKEGVILSSDLMDVETRLTEARVRQTAARTAIRVAVADLRRAIGLSQF